MSMAAMAAYKPERECTGDMDMFQSLNRSLSLSHHHQIAPAQNIVVFLSDQSYRFFLDLEGPAIHDPQVAPPTKSH